MYNQLTWLLYSKKLKPFFNKPRRSNLWLIANDCWSSGLLTLHISPVLTLKKDLRKFEVILTVHRRYYVEIKCQLDATDDIFADFIARSTCFGQFYAHHQELESIIQMVAACGIWCFGFQVVGMVWCWRLCVRFAGCCFTALFWGVTNKHTAKLHHVGSFYIYHLCKVWFFKQRSKNEPRNINSKWIYDCDWRVCRKVVTV